MVRHAKPKASIPGVVLGEFYSATEEENVNDFLPPTRGLDGHVTNMRESGGKSEHRKWKPTDRQSRLDGVNCCRFGAHAHPSD